MSLREPNRLILDSPKNRHSLHVAKTSSNSSSTLVLVRRTQPAPAAVPLLPWPTLPQLRRELVRRLARITQEAPRQIQSLPALPVVSCSIARGQDLARTTQADTPADPSTMGQERVVTDVLSASITRRATLCRD